jgi:UDP-4-amino-4,6-dideoxy-N-acetyl-beta-L-altrosamine transaminase
MKELAITGGEPVRKTKISYGRQWIDESDIQAVCDTLKSDYLTCGPKTAEAEKTLANYCGAKYAVLLNSDTSALHCACIAAGVGPDDEVITTPITFAASANCALYCGAKPVFADINPDTYNIDPAEIEKKITKKTKAVVVVDYTGQVVEMNEIRKICDKYNLVLIEDAAHSIGSTYNGKKVGNLSADMTCFSFHPVKTITSCEGGAVVTNDKELYKKVILAHAHGINHDVDELDKAHQDEPWYYEMQTIGYNYRITDVQAALLMSQLKKLDMFANKRKEIVQKYNDAFKNVPELILQKTIPESDTVRHLYVIQLNLEKLRCDRLQFFNAMLAEGIGCQIHYIPVYWFPYYKKLGYKKGLCSNAEKLYERIISIPLYPKMTDKDVNDVIKAVKKVINYYKK